MKPCFSSDAEKKYCPFMKDSIELQDLLSNRQDKHYPINSFCVSDRCLSWVEIGGKVGYCCLLGKS